MNSFALVAFVLIVTLETIITSPVENKPLDCPANEKYYKCSLEVCYKNCEHLIKGPPCPLIDANCYQPSCECVDGYLRDAAGTCVTHEQCKNPHSGHH